MFEARKLYVNDRVHTLELAEAGLELVHFAKRTAEWGYERAQFLNPSISALLQSVLVRQEISPYHLPGSLRRGWKRSEISATKLLVATRAIDYPVDLEKKRHSILEHNLEFPSSNHRLPVLDFFEDSWLKFNALQAEQVRETLGTLTWLGLAYAESKFLRTAVYAGVYLSR